MAPPPVKYRAIKKPHRMHITTLRIENFRNLERVSIHPHPRLNYFFGSNGAGKTSLLEALVVISRGKSFRTVHAEELEGPATEAFRVFIETESSGRSHKLGLERSGKQWRARMDGSDVALLSVLSRQLPLVLMEPNSHLLISGSPDVRRRFLDTGVFHVEPAFLDVWRRFARVLKQRNAALRARELRVLDSLDAVYTELGEKLHSYRRSYCEKLFAEFAAQEAAAHTAQQEGIALEYASGWKGESLAEAVAATRSRDLERGASGQGPHRADLMMTRDKRLIRTLLSRGEQKGLAASLLLTQARLLASMGGLPLVLLDDLASEFDRAHVHSVLNAALGCSSQVWVTGTARPELEEAHKMFHVKHGQVQEMV